jgi:hypothetical protein
VGKLDPRNARDRMGMTPTQWVRLVDVFVLGPLMIRAASCLRGGGRDVLVFSGVATILFNGINFVRVQRGDGVLP